MAKSASYLPPGHHSLGLHLTVKGASDYIGFLKKAFDATEISRAPMPDGRLMHAAVKIGDSVLMLADHFPEFGSKPIPEGDWPFRIQVYVPDVDAVWARALDAGCTVLFPLQDQFWGDRYGQVRDPFGFGWALATHVEDVSPEEMKARQANMFSKK